MVMTTFPLHEKGSLGAQCALVIENRTVCRDIENQVVALPGSCEVFLHIVDDMVCTHRAQHLEFLGAVHASHFSRE